MKWNIVIGTLVLSVGLCSQSFGFEFIDEPEYGSYIYTPIHKITH